jgi:hypothetical protein
VHVHSNSLHPTQLRVGQFNYLVDNVERRKWAKLLPAHDMHHGCIAHVSKPGIGLSQPRAGRGVRAARAPSPAPAGPLPEYCEFMREFRWGPGDRGLASQALPCDGTPCPTPTLCRLPGRTHLLCCTRDALARCVLHGVRVEHALKPLHPHVSSHSPGVSCTRALRLALCVARHVERRPHISLSPTPTCSHFASTSVHSTAPCSRTVAPRPARPTSCAPSGT